ncbi:unnamed protein product [Linum tenue]|uniref:Uncharacterized protein n=1 Tax=Linum tenue TaxID=586396 RepID=A0AAV0QN92_9ROSI|nr:unnamed protein product [Linum tenue]
MAKQKKRLRSQSQREESALVHLCRETLPLRLLFQRIRKKDKVTGTPIRLFLSLKLREWRKGPMLLNWKEKKSMLIRLLYIQLRTCHQRVEVRMNIGNREKSELAATGGSALLAKYRHEEDGTIQAEAEKVSQGEEPNKFAIYQEVIGPQRPKRVIGMGHGRLGVRLPESFDMDLNSEANGEQGRVGETHGNDVANDESDEETAEETTADA